MGPVSLDTENAMSGGLALGLGGPITIVLAVEITCPSAIWLNSPVKTSQTTRLADPGLPLAAAAVALAIFPTELATSALRQAARCFTGKLQDKLARKSATALECMTTSVVSTGAWALHD